MSNWERSFQGDSDRRERIPEWERLAEEHGVDLDLADRLYERAVDTAQRASHDNQSLAIAVQESYLRLLEQESGREQQVERWPGRRTLAMGTERARRHRLRRPLRELVESFFGERFDHGEVRSDSAGTPGPIGRRAGVPALAARGIDGGGQRLPHIEEIQRSFGRHDVRGVRAHVGGEAARAGRALGALAYAAGEDVAFTRAPDLRTAAHEAAHVIQQRRGARPPGGVGRAGDELESQADAVAAAVVRGESAAPLLDRVNGARGGEPAVQFLLDREARSVEEDDLEQGLAGDSSAWFDANGDGDGDGDGDGASRLDAGGAAERDIEVDGTAERDAGGRIRAELDAESESAAGGDGGRGLAGERDGVYGLEADAGGASIAGDEGPTIGEGSAGIASAPAGGETKELLSWLSIRPPSQAAAALASVEAASPAALEAEHQRAGMMLLELPAPTGIAAREVEEAEPELSAPREVSEAGLHPEGGSPVAEQPEEIAPEAPRIPVADTVLAGSDVEEASDEEARRDPDLEASAQQALAGVNLASGAVPTRAVDLPTVDLGGDADPARIEIAARAAGGDVGAAYADAIGDVGADFGERDIYPEPDEEILRAQRDLREVSAPSLGAEGAAEVELPAEALASIDAEAGAIFAERLGEQEAEYRAGKAEHDAEAAAAHERAREEIAEEEEQARETQLEARAGAREEVASARQDWEAEIDEVQGQFREDAARAGQEHRVEIAERAEQGNREAQAHIRRAEEDAAAERAQAEKEAEAEKGRAKKESKGFRGWVKRKAKGLIDGVKKAVNFVYDNLRKAVKAIFDAAKKLAKGAIELARRAIVLLITGFGLALNGFLHVALAAFPKARDRAKRKIDQAVERATGTVNRVAEGLKKAVAAIIDFVADIVDKVIELGQQLYSGILTVMALVITGELAELLKRVGFLVAAARTAPGQFRTAAYEELLGGDLDEPLSPDELFAAGLTPPGGMSFAGADLHDGEIPQPPWTTENVGVDEVVASNLPPELSQAVLDRVGDDGVLEFGESEEADRTLEALLGLSPGGAEHAGTEAAYTDGLTPRERAAVKWQVMKQGISQWFSENWPYVLAAGILAIAGLIVTGGSALLLLMKVLAVVFIGVIAVHIAGHVRDYLQKGWDGDIRGGGKSLAKALAALAIEIIALLTFKVGTAAVKGGKAAAHSAKAAARRAASASARAARAGVGYVIRGGKILLRGARGVLESGVRTVKALGSRLLSRTRFKGFRVRILGRRYVVEGRINPWIILMQGRLSEVPEGTPGARHVSPEQLDQVRRALGNMFKPGDRVMVPRSDGSTSVAQVFTHNVDGTVTVTWREGGKSLSKTVPQSRLRRMDSPAGMSGTKGAFKPGDKVVAPRPDGTRALGQVVFREADGKVIVAWSDPGQARALIDEKLLRRVPQNWMGHRLTEMWVGAKNRYIKSREAMLDRLSRPLKNPDKVELEEIRKAYAANKKELDRMGVGYSQEAAPNYFTGGRTDIAGGSLDDVAELGLLRVRSLPKPRGGGPLDNALSHPDLPKYIEEMRRMGIDLVIDPNLGLSGAGAYYWSFTKVIALKPGSQWTTFLHEFQHAQFDYFLRGRFHDLAHGVRNGRRVKEMLPADVQQALGAERVRKLEDLLQRQLPSLAVNESLSVAAELQALGFRKFILPLRQASALHSNAYALRHQANELRALRRAGQVLTPVQQRQLRRALLLSTLSSGGSFAAPLATLAAPGAGALAAVYYHEELKILFVQLGEHIEGYLLDEEVSLSSDPQPEDDGAFDESTKVLDDLFDEVGGEQR